jgi:cell division protein FtsW
MAQRLKTDWVLFFTAVAKVVFGLAIVTSASSVMATIRFNSEWHFVWRQAGWAATSFLALIYFKRMDYRRLNSSAWAFAPLGAIVGLLIVAYFLDHLRHRWLPLGPFSLQPSELAKPALIVFLAWFITARLRAINDRHTLAPAVISLGVLGGMVAAADLGTALVLVSTALVLFFVAGLEKKHLMAALAVAIPVGCVVIAMKPYRLARIVGFVDPDYSLIGVIDRGGWVKSHVQKSLAARDTSYQPLQSRIAIGSGGALGLGLGQGKQKLLYLPEAHTDFIYAVVGEELGLWGATGVLAGFLVILWRGLRLFWLAPDDFGRYLALGVTVSVVVQAFINMSVVLDIGPTKGFPLPMISYGGSSLLSTLTSLGMLLSVSEHSG